MSPQEYRDAIARLGLSQVRAGVFLGATDRTSRRWAATDEPSSIPGSVALALALAICLKEQHGMELDAIRELLGEITADDD
ncbi:MAG: hypothetical protein JNL41_14975 [Phenylobacterium sp.]|uniref:hypothetical protein n=1 Tax=Phenylobacterium sp. TaxID=1871053 RepID=UPI001A590EE8|nr:hypothetical protein [Phenylobacterium sp.]MBL8555575.1 hypothetical protein [Phenylobacterium sp.]